MKFGAKQLFKRGLDVALRAITFEIGKKKIIDEGIKHTPEVYRINTSKIKTTKFKRELESDVANHIAEETRKNATK